MRDAFLCPDCQKLGYCRKYNTKKREKTFDENEQAFFKMVKKPAKYFHQEKPVITGKLISLEKLRTQFRNQALSINLNMSDQSTFNIREISPLVNSTTQQIARTKESLTLKEAAQIF